MALMLILLVAFQQLLPAAAIGAPHRSQPALHSSNLKSDIVLPSGAIWQQPAERHASSLLHSSAASHQTAQSKQDPQPSLIRSAVDPGHHVPMFGNLGGGKWAIATVFLLVVACISLLLLGRYSNMNVLGLTSTWQRIVFAVNVTFFLSWVMLTHYTKDKQYSVRLFLIVVTVLEIFASLVLYRIKDGSFSHLVSSAIEYAPHLCLLVGPAGLYALSDMLRVGAIQRTDPLTYEVLANLRILLVAVVWIYVMKKRLLPTHWLGLFLICIGCTFKEVGRAWLRAAPLSGQLRTGYAELLLLCIFAALACVWNEKLLKHRSDVPLNLQNLALYTIGLAILLVVSIFPRHAIDLPAVAVMGHGGPLFNTTEWRAILADPLVMLQAALMAFAGVSVAYVLKVLSSIMREVACGVIMSLLVPLMYFVFGYPVGAPEFFGVVAVLLGTAALSAYPLPNACDCKSGGEQAPKKLGL